MEERKKLKLWHISDTHTFHGWLKIPDVDMVIFSGDCSNPHEVIQSEQECLDFMFWYSTLPIKYKIFVAGNHDIAIERKRISPEDFAMNGIIYLENTSTIIEGLKIWGSPITPSFGVGWAFNKRRDKIHDVWSMIPMDTDVVVAHGPAKGILDLSYSPQNVLEYCGCLALKKKILAIQPKLFCFGHIHTSNDVINAGYTKLAAYNTIFSNGSCVTDGRLDLGITSHGNIFEI